MKKYWRSLEELESSKKNEAIEPSIEFPTDGLSKDEIKNKYVANRRDFLKLLGFSTAYAVAATSCQQPVRKAIPFLQRPEEITPGVANHYATTLSTTDDYASVVVKVRDGRPIKIEGNTLSKVTQGGTNARIQAAILDLYDTARLQHPVKNGKEISWDKADAEITKKLGDIAAKGDKIYIIAATVLSPTTKKLFEEFKAKYPTAEVVYLDPVSYAALIDANEATFGKAAIPSYYFDKAKVIAGFNADFLGTWLSPVQFAADYAKTRDLTNGQKEISRHYQYETLMSLTGSNADYRQYIKPAQEKKLLIKLHNAIAAKTGGQKIKELDCKFDVSKLAKDLLANKGASLVVSGTNDKSIQVIVNAINHMLGNYGKTIDFTRETLLKQGRDSQLHQAFTDMKDGKVGAAIFYNANPVYVCPKGDKKAALIKKLPLSISLTDKVDETAKNVQYVLPDNNFLESWSDAEPYTGMFSLGQPTINKLWNTRQAQESFMKWAGVSGSFYDYLKNNWIKNILIKPEVAVDAEAKENAAQEAKEASQSIIDFTSGWNKALQDGVYEVEVSAEVPEFNAAYIQENEAKITEFKKPEGLQLAVYEKVGIGSGLMANNPWLQEMPDPITKATWDNYVTVAPKTAKEQGWQHEDVIKVKAGDYEVELPVLIQPGQDLSTIGIALGYGRTAAGPVADQVGGANAAGFISNKDGYRQYTGIPVEVSTTGKTYPLAQTQTHDTMEGRAEDIARETTLAAWQKDKHSGNEKHVFFKEKLEHVNLYKEGYNPEDYPGHHWGLAIDYNKCTGCSACIVACQVENNIAIVGKEQVRRRRNMHWLRIDRYYSTTEDKLYADVENNPEVFHQPVMCQHCDNAPCENVCPVAATPHTNEGLNAMAYNRCIGTRYCMNNCPYKVRRFNWFNFVEGGDYNYLFNDEVKRMVLNPDVVVRQRGVVEKCTLCVQRIQEGKLKAKTEGRELRDGEIQVACEQACPSNAIVFGDTNMADSQIIKLFQDERSYGLLEELKTLPSVVYMTKVRNKDEDVKTEA
jgi:MoCo/4Fe-4S cofactor protein with predicted Tat translocation signal